MLPADCGACAASGGGYLCPDRKTCAPTAADIPAVCLIAPGSLWDWTAPLSSRLADAIAHLTLQNKSNLLCMYSEEIPQLNIPRYDWWTEGQHGNEAPPGVPTSSGPSTAALAASFNRQASYSSSV